MIEEVKSPSTVDFESFSQESQPEAAETVVSDASNEDEIREKSLVYLVGSPDVRGIVMSITDLGVNILRWRSHPISWNRAMESVIESQSSDGGSHDPCRGSQ